MSMVDGTFGAILNTFSTTKYIKNSIL